MFMSYVTPSHEMREGITIMGHHWAIASYIDRLLF